MSPLQLSLMPTLVEPREVELNSKTGTSKLSIEDVKAIRRSVDLGSSQYSQAKRYGVSQATISYVINRRNYRDI